MSDPEQIPSILRVLGRRWTLPILKCVGSKEATRFCEIKKSLEGISSTVLSERLAELECEGLVAKTRSPAIEYRLTAGANELAAILAAVDRWSMRYLARRPVIAIQ